MEKYLSNIKKNTTLFLESFSRNRKDSKKKHKLIISKIDQILSILRSLRSNINPEHTEDKKLINNVVNKILEELDKINIIKNSDKKVIDLLTSLDEKTKEAQKLLLDYNSQEKNKG